MPIYLGVICNICKGVYVIYLGGISLKDFLVLLLLLSLLIFIIEQLWFSIFFNQLKRIRNPDLTK